MPTRQYALDAMRALAVCGVVAIHVIGMIVSNPRMKGAPSWWVAVAIDFGAVWAVPVFVMISGALTLHPRAHAAGPGAFYRKRFTRILPALVVWHLVYLFVVRLLIRDERLTFTGTAQMLIDAKVYTALYFLWLIVGLYVVAPVLAAFLRDGGPRRAGIMAAVALSWTLLAFTISGLSTLLGQPRPITLGAWTMWWPYVGYFLAGWALHRVVLSRRATLLAALLAVALLAEVAWQYGVRPAHRVLQVLLPTSYLGPMVAAAAICLFLVAVSIGARTTVSPGVGRVLVRLSEASFGVFLVHLLIFEIIRQSVPAVFTATSLPVMVLAYLAVLVASFAVSIGASKVPYLRAIF